MDHSAIGARLAALRKALRFSQAAMAERLGIGIASWRRYEGGERVPQVETLWDVLRLEPRTDPAWLLTGQGSMWRAAHADDAQARDVAMLVRQLREAHERAERLQGQLSDDEAALLAAYRAADADARAWLLEAANEAAGEEPGGSTPDAPGVRAGRPQSKSGQP